MEDRYLPLEDFLPSKGHLLFIQEVPDQALADSDGVVLGQPKIPLLGNGGSETHASLGTRKAQMSSTLVRHGCGVFASMDTSKMPEICTRPTPKKPPPLALSSVMKS